ncbi:hypothetical protein TNCT_297721 [Trichonephila clavata]|uniref:Uncharacterized protein n=1 Tax=Trichonephila clavata TaxID=2740835 RepID=A0A8X6HNF0_TRICU|nr:hypothetical protein TNCT_297721 [Trichonephila clavata]
MTKHIGTLLCRISLKLLKSSDESAAGFVELAAAYFARPGHESPVAISSAHYFVHPLEDVLTLDRAQFGTHDQNEKVDCSHRAAKYKERVPVICFCGIILINFLLVLQTLFLSWRIPSG